MASLRDEILERLSRISGPDGVPLPASGKLSEIVAGDGKVFFSITVEAGEVKAWERSASAPRRRCARFRACGRS